MQEQDFRWYKDNLLALYSKYGDKHIAIKDKTVLGSYNTAAEAIVETAKTEPIGSFIVQKCGADKGAYTISIATIGIR